MPSLLLYFHFFRDKRGEFFCIARGNHRLHDLSVVVIFDGALRNQMLDRGVVVTACIGHEKLTKDKFVAKFA